MKTQFKKWPPKNSAELAFSSIEQLQEWKREGKYFVQTMLPDNGYSDIEKIEMVVNDTWEELKKTEEVSRILPNFLHLIKKFNGIKLDERLEKSFQRFVSMFLQNYYQSMAEAWLLKHFSKRKLTKKALLSGVEHTAVLFLTLELSGIKGITRIMELLLNMINGNIKKLTDFFLKSVNEVPEPEFNATTLMSEFETILNSSLRGKKMTGQNRSKRIEMYRQIMSSLKQNEKVPNPKSDKSIVFDYLEGINFKNDFEKFYKAFNSYKNKHPTFSNI